MSIDELKILMYQAKMTLRVADTEGWSVNDGTRILANLAIKLATELLNPPNKAINPTPDTAILGEVTPATLGES